MTTLYDLLGALPDDDAEEIRAAFRKAVKSAHPDINPGDPDAAVKFRQIVRANEILVDQEQRAVYDHLLDLARIEKEAASKQAFAAAIYKVASGTMVLAGLLGGRDRRLSAVHAGLGGADRSFDCAIGCILDRSCPENVSQRCPAPGKAELCHRARAALGQIPGSRFRQFNRCGRRKSDGCRGAVCRFARSAWRQPKGQFPPRARLSFGHGFGVG